MRDNNTLVFTTIVVSIPDNVIQRMVATSTLQILLQNESMQYEILSINRFVLILEAVYDTRNVLDEVFSIYYTYYYVLIVNVLQQPVIEDIV